MYKIAVLRGGPSVEHEVSMHTGASVLEALSGSEFEPVDIIISKTGDWLKDGKVWEPAAVLQGVDGVFIALHGTYGEDGELQRFLETRNIPFTGSGSFASATAMNKALTKNQLAALDIKMAPHMHASRDQVADYRAYAEAVFEVMNGPFVVKPVSGGSSVGTVVVRNPLEAETALEELFSVFDKVLIEELIAGVEATVAVVDNFRNEELYALPTVEIVPPGDFFDYDAKYTGDTEEICPGRFSQTQKDRIAEAAKQVHRHLNLKQYSRSDFILVGDDVYFLEVNTLPGLTKGSLLPKALDAVSVPLRDFLRHVINDSLNHTPDLP